MKFRLGPFLFVLLTSASPALFATSSSPSVTLQKSQKNQNGLCVDWLQGEAVGKLETQFIDEASGMVVSRRFNKLYHVNDSGDGPYFYVTERDGSRTRKIEIEGYGKKKKPKDVEEISIGSCPSTGSGSPNGEKECLAIGDIGDNLGARKHIEVRFIEEKEEYGKSALPLAKLEFVYPDRAHNAEAFAILPNGDLVIVTKESSALQGARPAQVFRARKADLLSTKAPIRLSRLGEVDVPSMVKDKGLGGLVTGMSHAKAGTRFLILTYGKAIEMNLDLAADKIEPTANLKAGRDYNVIPISSLLQQEAIAYDTNDRDFFYSSEVVGSLFGRSQPSPFLRVRCQQ